MVIVAHPDDEVLGVGGTILKLQEEYGYDVLVEFMTTTRPNLKWDQVDRASKILGTIWDRPNCESTGEVFYPLTLDSEPITNLVDYIEPIIMDVRPDLVFTHHIGDLNQDHRAVSEAVLIATRPYPEQPVKKLYTFNTPSSTEWSFGEFKRFEPNVFIDISKYGKIKAEALEVYEEEIKNLKFPHPRSLQGLDFQHLAKGAEIGLKGVETFRLIRSIDIL